MPVFATPERSSYAARQRSFTLKSEDFKFDFPPAPLSAPTMKIEMDDDYADHGSIYVYNIQSASISSSATSSFYVSDFNQSPTPASCTSFGGAFNEWQLMTPTSSRRPSLDISFDVHGLPSSRVLMSSSPAVYGTSESYANNSNFNAAPYMNLQYSMPLSKSIPNLSMSNYAPPSMSNSMYSDFPQSFQNDPSSSTIFPHSSPRFQFSQSFINPSQTFYQGRITRIPPFLGFYNPNATVCCRFTRLPPSLAESSQRLHWRANSRGRGGF